MKRVIDGRDMVPPEPLELALAALEVLPQGEELQLLLFCHPAPLFDILGKAGWAWTERVLEDGTHDIRIRRK